LTTQTHTRTHTRTHTHILTRAHTYTPVKVVAHLVAYVIALLLCFSEHWVGALPLHVGVDDGDQLPVFVCGLCMCVGKGRGKVVRKEQKCKPSVRADATSLAFSFTFLRPVCVP